MDTLLIVTMPNETQITITAVLGVLGIYIIARHMQLSELATDTDSINRNAELETNKRTISDVYVIHALDAETTEKNLETIEADFNNTHNTIDTKVNDTIEFKNNESVPLFETTKVDTSHIAIASSTETTITIPPTEITSTSSTHEEDFYPTSTGNETEQNITSSET